MITHRLGRFCYSPMGTFGRLNLGEFTLYTVERPWLDNRPSISCIPEGTYRCEPRRYNRGGYDTVEVLGVPGRSHILFHRGNTMHDVEGCIALGNRLGSLGGLWAVLESREALEAFLGLYGDFPFQLEIFQQGGAQWDSSIS